MVTATFRFYQELGDFLPRERRGRTFATECAHRSTTKHMIEALGVPHTEVEMVLVNGEESGFDRALEEGDHIAVYARFELLEVGTHGGQGRSGCVSGCVSGPAGACASSPTRTWAAWRACCAWPATIRCTTTITMTTMSRTWQQMTTASS
ncbi:hypothetical protein [Massilia oculi]|uniref:hypothetical protein n=1 Tax=Massilia oculi TaxID=945844 RepID=UPI00351D9417